MEVYSDEFWRAGFFCHSFFVRPKCICLLKAHRNIVVIPNTHLKIKHDTALINGWLQRQGNTILNKGSQSLVSYAFCFYSSPTFEHIPSCHLFFPTNLYVQVRSCYWTRGFFWLFFFSFSLVEERSGKVFEDQTSLSNVQCLSSDY